MGIHCNRTTYDFRFHRNSFVQPLLFTCALITASIAAGASVASDSEATAAEQLKQLNDQTIIGSRVFLDTEWDDLEQGAEKLTWTLGGLWGWRVNNRQDWAVRLKVPIAYGWSSDASGNTGVGGLGDIELGTGTAFRLSKTWRTGGGIELHADTASDPALAERVWRVKPGWGIAHDVTDWLTWTFNAEYNYSIAEHHNVPAERYLELSLPVTIILPDEWSIFAKFKTKVDFENGDQWTHSVTGGVAKRLPSVPVVLSASAEKPLNNVGTEFQANFTMTYYFEK